MPYLESDPILLLKKIKPRLQKLGFFVLKSATECQVYQAGLISIFPVDDQFIDSQDADFKVE